MDDWRACSVTQLGLYVGLSQLFVADKISHKGCFTLQARCPEMVFLEERSNWESRPGPWAIRAATSCIGQWCVCHLVYMWQEGRVSCRAWGPAHSIHHLPIPREQRAAATTGCVGQEVTLQVHMVQPGHTFLVSPQTDTARALTHGFLPQEEVSADRKTSELKLFQEIFPVLSPACSSGHPPNRVVVVALGFHQATAAPRNICWSNLQVFVHSVHIFRSISAAGAGGDTAEVWWWIGEPQLTTISQVTCRTSYQTKMS